MDFTFPSSPRSGTERVCEGFLFLPMIINNRFRWLERVKWRERFSLSERFPHRGSWVVTRWED